MAYSHESVKAFWRMMRVVRSKPFLVRRLLERIERGEIDEQEAAVWLSRERWQADVEFEAKS